MVALTPGTAAILAARLRRVATPGRRGGDDVPAEGQLRVDARLLVVGGGEDPEVDPEGEQQPEDDQAPVDRRARAARR